MRLARMSLALFTVLAVVSPGQAAFLYSNGFEVDTTGWTGAAQVGSGSGGVTSASGAFHATATTGTTVFTTWGGYNFGAGNAVPTAFQEYWTAIDIYLNVEGGWANDTRFDFDSAINNSMGTFLRDFIFNAGFYNDATGPGAGTNRFVISASTNSQPGSAYAKNPARDPIAITTTGWYTFEEHFYDNGGVLSVDMSIYDSSHALVKTWTLNTADSIGDVGGNRYGWFDYNEFTALAFDNAELRTASPVVPEPTSLALAGFAGIGMAVGAWRRRRLEKPQVA